MIKDKIKERIEFLSWMLPKEIKELREIEKDVDLSAPSPLDVKVRNICYLASHLATLEEELQFLKDLIEGE